MDMSQVRLLFQPRMGWPLQVGVPDCGEGSEALALAHDGHQVFAADPDPLAVARARKLGGGQVLVDAAGVHALPWPSRSLDLCVLPRGWNGPVADLLRVLRPGGALYLRLAAPELRTRLALAGIAWLDQVGCGDEALLAFMPAPADCSPGAAESRSCCGPAA